MNTPLTTNTGTDKISIPRKIGYALGEVGCQCSWAMINSYLTVYYTDAVGLTPIVVSTIMMIARFWDAINDPIFGAIEENTRTKWGRYRPYILWGAPILALFNCLTFLNLDIPNSWKSIWCAVTYIGCGMAYTAVSIGTGCVVNVMTSSNKERVSMNAFKSVGSSIISLVISAVTMPMILFFGNGSTSSSRGYSISALVFSVVCVPCFIACFASTKEVIGMNDTGEKRSIGDSLKNVGMSLKHMFTNKNALLLMLALVLSMTALFGRVGILAYYFIYVIGDAATMATYMTGMSIGIFFVNFYEPYLLNRFSKKYVAAAGCLLLAVSCIFSYFVGEYHLTNLIFLSGFLMGFTNLVNMAVPTIIAEVSDENYVKTGVRTDGIIFSTISFASKLGMAIGSSLGVMLLASSGYVAGSENLSQTVLSNMNRTINLLPCILFVAGAIVFACNGITRKVALANEEKIRGMLAAQETGR